VLRPVPSLPMEEVTMHPPASRVVFDNMPYLVELDEDGSISQAFGPFTPGTEPSLAECGDGNRVRDSGLLATLASLLPLSPDIPAGDDTLAHS
jgi:hypothetical protein